MPVAGGEIAIREWVASIFLDREKEFGHGLIEAPSEEMRATYYEERQADAGAGTETQGGLDMLDHEVGLAGIHFECATEVPAACEARVSARARSTNAIMAS